jgi:hypothetical protein
MKHVQFGCILEACPKGIALEFTNSEQRDEIERIEASDAVMQERLPGMVSRYDGYLLRNRNGGTAASDFQRQMLGTDFTDGKDLHGSG